MAPIPTEIKQKRQDGSVRHIEKRGNLTTMTHHRGLIRSHSGCHEPEAHPKTQEALDQRAPSSEHALKRQTAWGMPTELDEVKMKLLESDGSIDTVNKFRKARGLILARQISELATKIGRPVKIIDVGGRRDYWENIGFEGVGQIVLLNIDPNELKRNSSRANLFVDSIGDACSLKEIEDLSFDLYHSNSVIEHVGSWSQMVQMAVEARRVAKSGWVQTPAWEFPIEPHFRLPFIHWLATPARASLLSFATGYRGTNKSSRRMHAERINLVSRGEFKTLFPNCEIYTERYFFRKSYTARW